VANPREEQGPLGSLATIWSIVPAANMYDDVCGVVGGMSTKGNRSTHRKPAPGPLRPPQIPYDLTRVWTRSSAVKPATIRLSAARPLRQGSSRTLAPIE
jgi:hypothetical protein